MIPALLLARKDSVGFSKENTAEVLSRKLAVYPIENFRGLDVDYKCQMPLVEYWLIKHGFDINMPYH